MSKALDKWKKRNQENEAKRGGDYAVKALEGVEFFKQEEKGTRLFKLLGYEVKDRKHPDADVGEVAFRRPYRKHKNLGPENKDAVCPGTFGKRCPVCEERERLRAGKDPDDSAIGALNASQRALYLVVDVEERKPKLLLMDQPMAMGKAPGFGRMLVSELEDLDDASPAPWEDGGPHLRVKFGKDTFNGRAFYPAEKVDLVDPGKEPNLSDLDVPCLDDALNVLSYEALERLFLGVEEEDEEKDENPKEEPPPPTRSREAPAKPAGRPARAPAPPPEPEPPADEFDAEAAGKVLEDLAEMELDEVLEAAEQFAVELDAADVKDAKKGDKAAKKALKAALREVLEAGLEDNAPPPEPTKPAGRRAPPAPAPKPEPAKPATSRRGAPAPKPTSGDCPKGHAFGADCDEYPEDCNTCDAWNNCVVEQERLKEAGA